MSRYQAFADETQRQALIADVREKGPIYKAWLTRASIEGDVAFVSADYGLHPALVKLLPVLGAFGEAEEARPFYEALLEVIPAGADTGALARRTLLLAWLDPKYGRSIRLAQGPIKDACADIAALVTKAIDEPVDKKIWRAARGRLAALGENAGEEDTVDLVMSLGWDLDQAPGAAHDVMSAWAKALVSEAEQADEDRFSEEDRQTFEAEMNTINEETIEALTLHQSLDDVSVEDFLAEAEKHWQANPVRSALKARAKAQRARTNARMAAWRAAIQARVLELARSLPGRDGQLATVLPGVNALESSRL